MTTSATILRAGPVALSILAVVLTSTAIAADEPYKRMLDDPLEFTGTETLPPEDVHDHEIVIGLFSPDDDNHPVGRAMTRGATLAVDRANAAGGIDGRPIRLIRRWADDPWGAGSKEVIKLAFSDLAWALIGGPDGASTHVAQQIATKAHIPLIAPVSSDPSLTHTRVPWIFRLPPDDAVQATLLVDEAIVPRGLEHIGVITSTDHDGRIAAAEFTSALERADRSPIFHLETAPGVDGFAELAARIASFEPDALIVRLPAKDLRRLAETLGLVGLEIPLFTPWVPGLDLRQYPLAYPGPVTSVAPFEPPRSCGGYLKLVRTFIAHHGEAPSPAAIYGYDAANLIVAAVAAGAAGRNELRRSLAESAPKAGASGSIVWDTGGGNRAVSPFLVDR